MAGLGTNPIPQPVQFRDTVLVMSGYRNPKLMAVRLGRTGDLTGTDAIVWETTRGTSYTASPTLHDGRLYIIADNGMLNVFNAATGTRTTSSSACPSLTTSRPHRSSSTIASIWPPRRGTWSSSRRGIRSRFSATNTLTDQSFIASPIAIGNDLYLRSRTHLFAIGK